MNWSFRDMKTREIKRKCELLMFGKKFDITDDLKRYESLFDMLCDMRIQWHINHKGGGTHAVFKCFKDTDYNTDIDKILNAMGFFKEVDYVTKLEREIMDLKKENAELKKNTLPRLSCIDEMEKQEIWH